MYFKKAKFGILDICKFLKMVPKRKALLESGSSSPLPETYRVNEIARVIHPGTMNVVLRAVETLSLDTKAYTFARADGKPMPFFKPGQYVTLTAKIGFSLVTRPYTMASSPKEALAGTITVAVKKVGLLSIYLFDNAKVGDSFLMGEPCGGFYHSTIRDNKFVVGIAGGGGITPFLSMAKAVTDGDEDFQLTVFYGAKNTEELLFKAEIDKLQSAKVKFVYVLSEQKTDDYESGFISAAVIGKYCDIPSSTFFMCGPNAMYDFVSNELAPFNLPLKAVHKDPSAIGDLNISQPKTYKLTVKIRDEVYSVPCAENETLLVALERAGIPAPNRCRAGGCGFCHAKWLKGDYYVAEGREKRREADLKFGFVHICCTYPKSDMELDVPKA